MVSCESRTTHDIHCEKSSFACCFYCCLAARTCQNRGILGKPGCNSNTDETCHDGWLMTSADEAVRHYWESRLLAKDSGAAAENYYSNMVPTTRPRSQISDDRRIVPADILAVLWTALWGRRDTNYQYCVGLMVRAHTQHLKLIGSISVARRVLSVCRMESRCRN
jgi:hypothetical protein